MRFIWLLFGGLLAVVLATGWHYQHPRAVETSFASPPALPILAVVARRPAPAPRPIRADSVVRFALAQLGIGYSYAGTSPATGFDCSGFVRFVFGRFAVDMPHSTSLLIGVGQPVPRTQARPGDIVVFTGTAAGSTTPGHAGIVISDLGETPLRFVHASSAKRESGVKISQVEGSGYEQRFMQVRRVLSGGPPSSGVATSLPRPAAAAGIVAALPPRSAKVTTIPGQPLLPPPVTPLPVRHWSKPAAPTPVAAAKRPASRALSTAPRKAAPVRHKIKAKTKTKVHAHAVTAAPTKLVTKHKRN
ncbi:C40 family peptidase [Hymenobacter bucti]|uniref:C40 family peptidase n=1 Tax=Hymenobacter bucti TaxID=1844114 RepID=A0ABW4QTH2_9BACT